MSTTQTPEEDTPTDAPEPSPPLGRGWWGAALAAAAVGVTLTGLQVVEKITVLKDPAGAILACDINATLSCSRVLDAWQSSVLGPPNALIGAVMFAILGSAALAGVTGSRLSRGYLLTMWGLAVGFAAFATWFMAQTAYVIGALCLWCTGITTAVLVIVAATTRMVAAQHALPGRAGRALGTLVHSRTDVILVAGWWVAVAVMLATGLTR